MAGGTSSLTTSRCEGRHIPAVARRGVWLGLTIGILFGLVACLSDVTVPRCLELGERCTGASGGGGNSGTADREAGLGGDPAGVGGTSAKHVAGAAGNVSAVTAENASNAGSAADAADAGGAADAGAAGAADSGGAAPRVPCDSCQISPEALPAPCGADQYSTALNVLGGTPPYVWRIASTQDQWSIGPDPTSPNGSKAKLSGRATGPTNLTIEVSDAESKSVRRSYAIEPRSRCWFAYTALQTTGPVLELLDPVLKLPAPATLAHNQGVYDFKFSPNGQYLAYRFGADLNQPKGRHIALLNLTTWTEQVLTFGEDAVIAFSWSKSSTSLAVAFASSGITYLGGVRLSASATEAAGAELVTWIPKPAFVNSELFWIGETYLAFYAAVLVDPLRPTLPVSNFYGRLTAFYAPLGATGFGAPAAITSADYGSDVTLQPADDGFFMLTANSPFTFFDALPVSGLSGSHSFTSLVAPSGRFSAELWEDQLQLFAARTGDLVPAPAYASADGQGCPKLLAWAKGKERIACVANVVSDAQSSMHGEIRIFDVQPPSTLAMSKLAGYCVKNAGALPVESTCGALEYDYTVENSSVQARAFSASGRWFAFTTGSSDIDGPNYLYWADVDSQPLSLKRKTYLETSSTRSTSPTALAFSADEHSLLLQRGDLLSAYDLTAAANSGPDSAPVYLMNGVSQATAACSEDFPSAPDRWCGNAERVLPFRWASDSRYAAFRQAGSLTVVDFTIFNGPSFQPLLAPDCNQMCDGQFAFQPESNE